MSKWRITKTVLIIGVISCIIACGYRSKTKTNLFLPAGETSAACLDVMILERVYDGDTFYVTFPSWHPIVGKNIGIRVNGIDTPELRTKSIKEKELGYKAKALMVDILQNAERIELCNVQRGKYFRIVADVIADGNDVAGLMIDAGLAVPYDGGTKIKDWNE